MAIKVIQHEWNSLGAGERQLSSLTSNGSMLRHCPKPGGTATPTLPGLCESLPSSWGRTAAAHTSYFVWVMGFIVF